MERAFAVVDRLSTALARIACWCAPLMVLTLTYEVVVRYAVGAPTLWSYDVSYFLNSFMVTMGAAYTLLRRGHITVDVISSRYPRRLRVALDLVLGVTLLLPMCAALLWAMWPNLQRSWAIGERAATGTWLPPIYPFKAWVFAGIALLLLQAIVQAIRDAMILFSRRG